MRRRRRTLQCLDLARCPLPMLDTACSSLDGVLRVTRFDQEGGTRASGCGAVLHLKDVLVGNLKLLFVRPELARDRHSTALF